jgi:hypothetical protein
MGPAGADGIEGPTGPTGPAGPAGSGGGGSYDTQTFKLELYYKIVPPTTSPSYFIFDISHNLPSFFSVLITGNGDPLGCKLYIQNSKITNVNESNLLLPVSCFKEWAINTGVTSNTVNPFTQWNFNKVWTKAPMTGFTVEKPFGSTTTVSVLNVTPTTNASDITLTTTRNSTFISNTAFTTGTSTTIAQGTLTPTPGTFIGNTITCPAAYTSSGVAGGSVILTPGTAEAGPDLYLNLVNLYMTFPSSICQ